MDSKRRSPRVMCEHCQTAFQLPERFELGNERRVQLQCPQKQCGEWSWYERHQLGTRDPYRLHGTATGETVKKKPMTVAQILAVALTPAEALARMKGERTKKKSTTSAAAVIPTRNEALARAEELTKRIVAVPKSEAVKPRRRRKH
jgi:hypothetical protein